ncbi:MAG: LacI family DNA-binding transcriptional regulator [Candidatus Omnitrophica bacterium]|nr:LacI family DNA-binding transcriptional regulator [Candidatus Omnitrophota bacterium]
MKKKATLRDVSRKAGVSQGTVSRVLNGRPVRVHPNTRDRVLSFAAELGYTPNRNAQALKTGRTGAIGLLARDLADGFVIDCLRSMEATLAQMKMQPSWITSSGMGNSDSEEMLASASRLPIDGLVVIESGELFTDAEILRFHAEENLPIVTVLRRVRGGYVSNVCIDVKQGMRKVVEHLVELGHSKIALCQPEAQTEMSLKRAEGFVETMRENGVPIREDWMPAIGRGTFEDGVRLGNRLLRSDDRPTAIIGWMDLVSFALVRVCAERGLRIPRDISIAGLENIRTAAYYNPPLTALDPDFELIGRRSIEMLNHQIEKNIPLFEATEETVIPRLVIRESTGPATT